MEYGNKKNKEHALHSSITTCIREIFTQINYQLWKIVLHYKAQKSGMNIYTDIPVSNSSTTILDVDLELTSEDDNEQNIFPCSISIGTNTISFDYIGDQLLNPKKEGLNLILLLISIYLNYLDYIYPHSQEN